MALPQGARWPARDSRPTETETTASAGPDADGETRSFLVVTRRAGESLRIGENVLLVLIHTEGHQVKIGVQAPREVPVVRGELLARRDPG